MCKWFNTRVHILSTLLHIGKNNEIYMRDKIKLNILILPRCESRCNRVIFINSEIKKYFIYNYKL